MIEKRIRKMLILVILFMVISCQQNECKNSNLIFDKYQSNTYEYKKELSKELKVIDNSKLTYRFQRYENVDNKDYIYITIQGDGLCAESVIKVTTWDDILIPIKETKGMGYSGAELKNLKIISVQEDTKTVFVYKSVEAIID